MEPYLLDAFAARSVGVTLADFTSPRTPRWRARRTRSRRGGPRRPRRPAGDLPPAA